MGEVWKAKHRLIARPAAIKLIRPEALGGSDQEHSRMMDRFKREAEATASMRSPHTIEVYDFGVTDDGAFYYVMELLDGIDLETLVRRFGAAPPERVIHLLTQMCRSLGEAHERNLIHRDIKPANIFVCRHGREDDFVKVLDFGLVKSSASSTGTDQALTREHTALGTPAFMAPEQVVGQDAVDARTDIYAMGCVAYWLLTGMLVFDGDSAGKMMMQQVREAPVAPSERVETPVPKELDAVVLRCLSKESRDRPQSVDELADALNAIPGAHDWTPARARAWWQAHLPVAGSAGA
jgi:serine/threonine-protein kinase